MARSRNIKPGFFKNEFLAEMSCEVRLLFIGLWTLADREGRLEDRPKRIKAELFAFDSFDVDSMLSQLQSEGFLLRYEVDGTRFIQVENFVKHQDPHYKEKASEIPAPHGRENFILASGVTRTQRARILERDGYKCMACEATEHLCIDHILPVSRGGDSSDENLQTLCLPCNTKKGNKLDGEEKNSRQRRVNVESTSGQSGRSSPPDSLSSDSSLLIPDSLVNTEPTVLVGLPPDGDKSAPPDRVVKLADRRIPCPADALLEAFHAECPTLPRVIKLNEKRRTHLIARWREVDADSKFSSAADGIEVFRGVFRKVNASDFLTGRAKSNGRSWSASFDWLFESSTNFLKVCEGRYDNESGRQADKFAGCI